MKSEKATPRRLRKEALKGRVSQSRDLLIWVTLAAGLAACLGATSLDAMRRLFHAAMILDERMTESEFAWLIGDALLMTVGPTWLGVMLASASVSLIQSKGVLATERSWFDLSKLNALQGLKRLVSANALKELAKALLYALASVVICIVFASMYWRDLAGTSSLDAAQWGDAWIRLSTHSAMAVLLGLLPVVAMVAAIDHVLFLRGMRMDKQEVKQERMDAEGRPEVKRRIREIAQELSQQERSDVAGSNVILANPTHIAVGIWFDQNVVPLPFVSLHLRGVKARQAIELARSLGIPVVRDVALARSLHADSRRYQFVSAERLEPVMRLLHWLREVECAGRTEGVGD